MLQDNEPSNKRGRTFSSSLFLAAKEALRKHGFATAIETKEVGQQIFLELVIAKDDYHPCQASITVTIDDENSFERAVIFCTTYTVPASDKAKMNGPHLFPTDQLGLFFTPNVPFLVRGSQQRYQFDNDGASYCYLIAGKKEVLDDDNLAKLITGFSCYVTSFIELQYDTIVGLAL